MLLYLAADLRRLVNFQSVVSSSSILAAVSMKMKIALLIAFLVSFTASAQPVSQRLRSAVSNLEADEQVKNGSVGLFLMSSKTGAVLFNHNGRTVMTPASAQKIITSAAAFHVLGKDYRYKTELAIDGKIDKGTLNGDVYIIGFGDPSLGSWRYESTKEDVVMKEWLDAIENAGIKKINGKLYVYDKNWESQTVPSGWTWDDMGNYYGAGASAFNWRENQYDIILSSAKPGDAVQVVSTTPQLYGNTFFNELKAGDAGSGDNAYIFRAPLQYEAFVRGTIPPYQRSFTISGSFPSVAYQLSHTFAAELQSKGFGEQLAGNDKLTTAIKSIPPGAKVIHTHLSPSLDSLSYWFLKKSVNLYGEAFVKTIAFEKTKKSNTNDGVEIVEEVLKLAGVGKTEARLYDGSGLSPKNRVTAEALTKVMAFAQKQPWYKSFAEGLPLINNLKMKSGTMGGVKSFTGYSGDYIFAIIVNNYSGSHADIQRKIWRVLDVLK